MTDYKALMAAKGITAVDAPLKGTSGGSQCREMHDLIFSLPLGKALTYPQVKAILSETMPTLPDSLSDNWLQTNDFYNGHFRQIEGRWAKISTRSQNGVKVLFWHYATEQECKKNHKEYVAPAPAPSTAPTVATAPTAQPAQKA